MLEEPLEPGAVIGSTPLQLGLSAATYGIGHAFRSPRMMTVGADLFRAELVAQALTMGMKESFRRHRPEGSGFAFPSGHTTVSFASATVLQEHFGWKVGFPAYALASYVAVSRVHMKRHYLSDVAFGAALGIAAGRTIVVGHGQKWRVEPMASLAGGGVQVRWLGKETRN
jgi:membrane-associated phospholipid phosphatase